MFVPLSCVIKPTVLSLIAAKLAEQHKRCVDEDGGCMYDDGEGNHCAIGWLMTEGDIAYLKRVDIDQPDAFEGLGGSIGDISPTIVSRLVGEVRQDGTYHGSVMEALATIQGWHDTSAEEFCFIDVTGATGAVRSYAGFLKDGVPTAEDLLAALNTICVPLRQHG